MCVREKPVRSTRPSVKRYVLIKLRDSVQLLVIVCSCRRSDFPICSILHNIHKFTCIPVDSECFEWSYIFYRLPSSNDHRIKIRYRAMRSDVIWICFLRMFRTANKWQYCFWFGNYCTSMWWQYNCHSFCLLYFPWPHELWLQNMLILDSLWRVEKVFICKHAIRSWAHIDEAHLFGWI